MVPRSFALITTAPIELLEQFPGAANRAGSDAGRHPHQPYRPGVQFRAAL